MFPYKTWPYVYFDRPDHQIRFSTEKPHWDSKAYLHTGNILNSYQALTEQDENHFSANSKKDKQDISPAIKQTTMYNKSELYIFHLPIRSWVLLTEQCDTNTITQHVSTWPCKEPSSACGAAVHPSSSSDEGLCVWRVLDISVQRGEEKHFIDNVITHIHNVSTKTVRSWSFNSPVWWSPVWCCVQTPGSRWRSVSSAAFLCGRSSPDPPEW